MLVWLPLAAPIGLSPLHIPSLCGSERVLVVSTGGGGVLKIKGINGGQGVEGGIRAVPTGTLVPFLPFSWPRPRRSSPLRARTTKPPAPPLLSDVRW